MRLSLLLGTAVVASAHYLTGLPTVPFKADPGGGQLDVSKLKSIVIDSAYVDARDTEGDTLIPPTLGEFAHTFADDLAKKDIKLKVTVSRKPCPHSIFLTVGDTEGYLDRAGRVTSEGYTLSTEPHGVVISGASPLGVWWGTRTLLQQVVLGDGHLPLGSGKDAPGWGQRGVMVSMCLSLPI